jgi:6-phosphofructokinase
VIFLKGLIRKNLNRVGVPSGLTNDIKGFKIVLGNKVTGKSIKEAVSEIVSTDETIFSG